jgi:hypothetical protein
MILIFVILEEFSTKISGKFATLECGLPSGYGREPRPEYIRLDKEMNFDYPFCVKTFSFAPDGP